jgi:hypothetical protein
LIAPDTDAVAVVPATFNTLHAWANGTANTYSQLEFGDPNALRRGGVVKVPIFSLARPVFVRQCVDGSEAASGELN